MKARFGGCQFDTEARQLSKDGREVHLSPKAFEVLTYLLEARPRAVAKAELLDRVWAGVFVSEASLARVVNEIRDAIGDRQRDDHIVRTVHGYGYAFAAELEAEPQPTPSTRHLICWLTYGGRDVGLSDGEHLIGRDPTVTVCLDSPKVSRHHARMTVNGASAILEDLGSKNGSFLSGERVSVPTPLRSGDIVQVGPFTLIFRIAGGMASTETEAGPRSSG